MLEALEEGVDSKAEGTVVEVMEAEVKVGDTKERCMEQPRKRECGEMIRK